MQQIADGTAPRSALALIPLMQGGNESANIEMWMQLAASEPEAARRTDYGALAHVFADAVKKRDVWRNALKEWNMRESMVIKEWEDRARQEQGVEWVLEVLQDKFGTLPSDLSGHLQAIEDSKILRRLLLKAVHAGNLDDFRKQIPNGTQNGSQRDEH